MIPVNSAGIMLCLCSKYSSPIKLLNAKVCRQYPFWKHPLNKILTFHCCVYSFTVRMWIHISCRMTRNILFPDNYNDSVNNILTVNAILFFSKLFRCGIFKTAVVIHMLVYIIESVSHIETRHTVMHQWTKAVYKIRRSSWFRHNVLHRRSMLDCCIVVFQHCMGDCCSMIGYRVPVM